MSVENHTFMLINLHFTNTDTIILKYTKDPAYRIIIYRGWKLYLSIQYGLVAQLSYMLPTNQSNYISFMAQLISNLYMFSNASSLCFIT